MNDSTPCYQQGNMEGYAIEARIQGDRPGQIGDEIFDNRWRRVSFNKVRPPFGVPNPRFAANVLDQCSLYGYYTAQALRYWLHAEAENSLCVFSLETRLVSHNIAYKVEWKRAGDQELVGTWTDKRSAPTVDARHATD